MAAVTPASDQAAGLLQKLSLDSQNKSLQSPDPAKKVAAVQHAPVDTISQANGSNNQFETSAAPFGTDFSDKSMFQNPNGYASSTYYYGGAFNGSSVNDWERYSSSNGVDMSSGVYGDYQNSYGYAPYVPYSSSSSLVGYDSQLYAPQHYQYPTSYFQPSSTNDGSYSFTGAGSSRGEVSIASVVADQLQISMGTTKGNQSAFGNGFSNQTNVPKPVRPNYQKPLIKSNDLYGWGGLASASSLNSSALSYESNFASGRNQNLNSLPHLMGLQHPQAARGVDLNQAGFMSQIYPGNRMYGQYPATYRGGPGYPSSNYDSRLNGHGWLAVDNKYKSRGRSSSLTVYGNGGVDGLNELNKGPRSKGFKDLKESEPITLAVKGQSLPLKGKIDEDNLPLFPDRDQYNKVEFPKFDSDAKFFVIKSYSEDDVHKSIKYGVWSSTTNGNKKLDDAYKEAQQKPGACPVFLLFSVNASGQFVGLAEMTGRVDFDRTVEYWQQDKWTGCFPLKWHIIKDVPNGMLRHITLPNNENKPVTNSRDTQEVMFEQGTEIIKVFKGHLSSTCILDDFEFYEGRQRTMQERKAKQREFDKQVNEMTAEDTERTGSRCNEALQRSAIPDSSFTEDSIKLASGAGVVESRGNLNDGFVVKAEDSLRGSPSDIEEYKAIANGAA